MYRHYLQELNTGAVSGDGPLMEAEPKVTEKKAQKFVLIEADAGKAGLAYRERSGKLSKCIHEPQVYRIMIVLHELHGHFSDQITMKRCIRKFFWPTRHKDIFILCRSCPMCQMIGLLGKPNLGWVRTMLYSLTQQAIRGDLEYWILYVALRADGNPRLVSYPYYTKYAAGEDSTVFHQRFESTTRSYRPWKPTL